MKKLVLLAALFTMSAQNSHALESSTDMVGFTFAELIVVTASSIGSSQALTISTQVRKLEAQKVQVDVQAYNQNGQITVFLGEKISALRNFDPSLSIDESVDELLAASESILAQ